MHEGLLDAAGAQKVREVAKILPLDDAIRQVVPKDRAMRVLAAHFAIPYVELAEFTAPKEFLSQFPVRVLLNHHLLPLREEDGVVVVTTIRIFDTASLDELRLATGRDLRPALAPLSEIDLCIKRLLGIGADTLQSMASEVDGVKIVQDENDDLDLSATAENASIIRFVNQILSEALELRAIDVHVEPLRRSFGCAIALMDCCKRPTSLRTCGDTTRRSSRDGSF